MELEAVRTKPNTSTQFNELLQLNTPTTNPKPLQLDIKTQIIEHIKKRGDVTPRNKEFGSSFDVAKPEGIITPSLPRSASPCLQLPPPICDSKDGRPIIDVSNKSPELQSWALIDENDLETGLRRETSLTSPVSPTSSSSSAFIVPDHTKTIPKGCPSLYQPKGRRRSIYVGLMREHPIPSSLEVEWVKDIRKQLVKDLDPFVQALPRELSRKDTVYEPELCMAGELQKGTQDVQLKPTVWIRCGSKKCKRRIKSAVKDLSYLHHFSHGGVQVGLSAPRAAGTHSEQTEKETVCEQENEVILVVEKISNTFSACGLRLKISTSRLGMTSTCFSTIGGLIQVNGIVYGLTTAHSLVPEKTFGDDEVSTSSDTLSEDSESDVESLATESFTNDKELHENSSTSPGPTIAIGSPRLGPISFAGDGADFALIDLGLENNFLRNEYMLDNIRTIISTWERKDDDPYFGQIHILCAFQDVREGFLLKEKSMFIQEGAIFHTRKIQMSQPLAPGSSGSWVVHGGTLLGYLVAVYDSEPYAHMISIHDALALIEGVTRSKGAALPPHHDLVDGEECMADLEFSELELRGTRQNIDSEKRTLDYPSTATPGVRETDQIHRQMSESAQQISSSPRLKERYGSPPSQDLDESHASTSVITGWTAYGLRQPLDSIDDDDDRINSSDTSRGGGTSQYQPWTHRDVRKKQSWFLKDRWIGQRSAMAPSSARKPISSGSSTLHNSHGFNAFMTEAWIVSGMAWPWISFVFGLAWLIPAAFVLWTNFTDQIVGPSVTCLQPGEKCKMNFNSPIYSQVQQIDRTALVGIQVAAKALDAWFCFIAACLIWAIVKRMAGQDPATSLPAEYLHFHTECADIRVIPNLVWATIRAAREMRRRKVRVYAFAALVVFVCILCILMGSATAVLLIPSLQWIDINQAQGPWMETILSDRRPQHSALILSCSADNLTAGNYSCTGLIHSAAMAYVVASATEPSHTLPRTGKWDRQPAPFLQEGNISFTIDLSTLTVWIPSRQILRGFSADLDNFDATTTTGGGSSEEHSEGGLSKRSTPTISDDILQGISEDMRGSNTTSKAIELSTKGYFETPSPSQTAEPVPTSDSVQTFDPSQTSNPIPLSDHILHGVSIGLNKLNTTAEAVEQPDEGYEIHTDEYPDSAFFVRSLQSRLQRHGPIFGERSACFRTHEVADILVGPKRTVRCFGNADVSGIAKCIPQGAGWTNVAQASSSFSIQGFRDFASTTILDVSVYTTSSSLYISSPIIQCIQSHTCDSGLDWNMIFTPTQDIPPQNTSGPQQTIVYTQPFNYSSPYRWRNSTSVWCDLQILLGFVDYTVDPNPINDGTRLVETSGQMLNPIQPLFVHSDWTMAAWSVDKGSHVQTPGSAARALSSTMHSWVSNDESPQASTTFNFIHSFIMAQAMTLLPFNTTMLKPSNATSHPQLSRKAMIQVWKYGLDSNGSVFGAVIMILGIVLVLIRAAFYDKEPTGNATDILVTALQQQSAKPNNRRIESANSTAPLLGGTNVNLLDVEADYDDEEEEDEERKEFPVLYVKPSSGAYDHNSGTVRRVPYKERLRFHG